MKTKGENDTIDLHEEFRKWEIGFWKKVFAAIIVMMAGLLIILSSINTIPSAIGILYIVVAFLIFGGCLWAWLEPFYGKGRILDKLEEENKR